jgi:hypothetical protein
MDMNNLCFEVLLSTNFEIEVDSLFVKLSDTTLKFLLLYYKNVYEDIDYEPDLLEEKNCC